MAPGKDNSLEEIACRPDGGYSHRPHSASLYSPVASPPCSPQPLLRHQIHPPPFRPPLPPAGNITLFFSYPVVLSDLQAALRVDPCCNATTATGRTAQVLPCATPSYTPYGPMPVTTPAAKSDNATCAVVRITPPLPVAAGAVLTLPKVRLGAGGEGTAWGVGAWGGAQEGIWGRGAGTVGGLRGGAPAQGECPPPLPGFKYCLTLNSPLQSCTCQGARYNGVSGPLSQPLEVTVYGLRRFRIPLREDFKQIKNASDPFDYRTNAIK